MFAANLSLLELSIESMLAAGQGKFKYLGPISAFWSFP
jgi:hypothetical protein